MNELIYLCSMSPGFHQIRKDFLFNSIAKIFQRRNKMILNIQVIYELELVGSISGTGIQIGVMKNNKQEN